MKRLRTIAIATLVFGVLGPGIGGLIAFAPTDPPGGRVLGLAYVFGTVPALIAGAIYGVVTVRAGDRRFPWHTRALIGAGAGLASCVAFVLVVMLVFPIFGRGPAFTRNDARFFRIMGVAGVSAGAVCGLALFRRKAAT